MLSTACPRLARPSFSRRAFAWRAPFIELPTEENKARIAAFRPRSRLRDMIRSWRRTLPSRAGEQASTTTARPPRSKAFPTLWRRFSRSPTESRTADERNSLDSGLRKYFVEKVRPGLVERLPPIGRLEGVKKQLADYKADKVPRVMVMSDAQPRQTSILTRGEYLKPAEKVSFSTPKFLPPLPKKRPDNRLGFACWLFIPEHPLTARVQVNRIWQHFFGAGIIKTSEDFGVQSEYPIHGALLDWLAVEFRTRGWSQADV